MAFEETRMDDEIAYGSTFIPGYSTRVITSAAGYESRNANWAQTRLKFNIATGIKTQANLDKLINQFHAVRGKLIGFRFRDWSDFTSKNAYDTPSYLDQNIFGPAVGGETEVQLIKSYPFGNIYTSRDIKKPVTGTVVIGVGPIGSPVELLPGQFSVDYTTGIVTLSTPLLVDEYVTAGYEFDVPVRFDTDELPVILDAYKVGNFSVNVIEVRED